MQAGGADDMWGLGGGGGRGALAALVESEVRALIDGALAAACAVVTHNAVLHSQISAVLAEKERMEGPDLAGWLERTQVPEALRVYIEQGPGAATSGAVGVAAAARGA